MCVCLLVCWFVCFLSATRHLSTLRRCLRVAESRISRRRERPRARGQAHACAQREQARACRTTSQRKNRCADAFQKQNRTRAHAVVYVTAEILKKKGKRKPTCHFPSSVYSLPSLGVFTFRIVLNRILHKSSLLAPIESTKNTIMPVYVIPIRQAAPFQRRIISISEASNQLLFHYQKCFVEWICWRMNIFLKLCSRSKKLRPGWKPNSFAFRNPGRPRRSINCSRDGSRTASRFAIQVNRDGRSNCSQLGCRPSPANKPCLCQRNSRRSSGQTRRRSASDGCRKGRWETWSCWQCGCFHPQLSWYSYSALIVSVGIFGW